MQMGRERAFPGRADQHVASELEGKFLEVAAGRAIGIGIDQFIGWDRRFSSAEVKAHTVVKFAVVGLMACPQFVIGLRGRIG